jgi:hypothetical protein
MDIKKSWQASFSPPLQKIYENYFPHIIESYWIRLAEAPPLEDGISTFNFLKQRSPFLYQMVCDRAKKYCGGIIGFLAPQEVRKGEPLQEGWFFMAWSGQGAA